jgi:putative ABC transport system permease protein
MLRNYLKLAVKVPLRRKVFTAISLVGIGLTLVVLTVVVALLDAVFAPRPPEVHLERTLGVWLAAERGEYGRHSGFAGYGLLDRYARDLPGVERMTVFSVPASVVSYVEGRRLRSFLKRTDGAFWQVLDFDFLEGGPYTPADAGAGSFVAVINASTRDRFFGGSPAVGRTIEVDGQRFRVVGVVADVPILRLAPFADVWVPIATAKWGLRKDELVGGFAGLLVARDRRDFPAIKAALQARLAAAQLPDPQRYQTIVSGADTHFEALSRMLSPDPADADPGGLAAGLAAAALAFMLLPALNLVNLNLSRILERAGEIGVRKAFGATSRALVGQFLVENVVLTLLGGLAAFAVAAAVLAGVEASGLLPYAELAVNGRVFLAGLALAAVFGVLSGVYPAWRMSRMAPAQALSGRSS